MPTCKYWFQFESGDFDVNDKESAGAPQKHQHEELEILLNVDACQTFEKLSAALDVDQFTVEKTPICAGNGSDGRKLGIARVERKGIKRRLVT
ncbi:hypothetical protein Trydic_g3065 [Trypoxylus dichotomus]